MAHRRVSVTNSCENVNLPSDCIKHVECRNNPREHPLLKERCTPVTQLS